MNHMIAAWTFNTPMTRTYVYRESTETFRGITKITAFSTGCHCLREAGSERVFIVPAGWRYIVQERSGASEGCGKGR